MGLTELRYFLDPVRIVRVVAIVSGVVAEIHELHDTCGNVALLGVEVSFLQHHGVAVTIQHLHTFGLPRARETIAEVDARLTAGTTTGSNFNNTVRTT